ncbi:MAG: cold shock domain-containing protein [Thiobacillus sp.]|nr:cold shock domain-containing protein [Thiobacillus sp.]
MRIEGTLTKWNDDRGFGFIKPSQGGAEIFAHVSAFPRDEQRPRIGERLSFEIVTGKDGKKQAKNILCPTRQTEKPYRLSEPARRSGKPSLFGRLIPLVLVIALGAYGYNEYTKRTTPLTTHAIQSRNTAAQTSPFHCDGRTHCSQMTSCAEAEFFLKNCPNVEMDGNHDGAPCEQQWCNK